MGTWSFSNLKLASKEHTMSYTPCLSHMVILIATKRKWRLGSPLGVWSLHNCSIDSYYIMGWMWIIELCYFYSFSQQLSNVIFHLENGFVFGFDCFVSNSSTIIIVLFMNVHSNNLKCLFGYLNYNYVYV